MDFLPYSQEYMLIVSIMGGMLLGLIWDIYRLIRHYFNFKSIGTFIGDIAYWVVSVYFSIQLINDISYGNLRFFLLIGFLSGALLYFITISNYILKAFIFVIDTILKVIKKIINLLVFPFNFVKHKIKAFTHPIKIKIEIRKNKAKRQWKFYRYKLKRVFKNKKIVYNKNKHRKTKDKRLRKKEQKSNERSSKNNRVKKKN